MRENASKAFRGTKEARTQLCELHNLLHGLLDLLQARHSESINLPAIYIYMGLLDLKTKERVVAFVGNVSYIGITDCCAPTRSTCVSEWATRFDL
jgi:hypothetical protein